MDWLERMNGAIQYIEDHLAGEIEYREVARIAGCSVHHFQRMFSFITNVPLSEYVRRRRLTVAAFELQASEIKVIDLAHKYGYESPEAFSRAFQVLHGVSPSKARAVGVQLQAYPVMSFTISIKGDQGMKYRMEERPAFSVAGVKKRVSLQANDIPRLWEEAGQNGLMQRLIEMLWNGGTKQPHGILGICADGDHGRNDEFDYYMAVVSNDEPASDMEKLTYPGSTWAVFEVTSQAETLDVWKRIYTEWVPTSGYELANLPAMECYYPPGHAPEVEIWVAVDRVRIKS